MNMGMGMMGGTGTGMFTIDGRTFDPDRDDQTVPARHRRGVDRGQHQSHGSSVPSARLAVSGAGNARRRTPTGLRQDVVLVPARGWVRLRIPFTDYPGRSVYHCHVLDHEDLGMMATINVHR